MKNLATGHTRSKLIFSANRFIFVVQYLLDKSNFSSIVDRTQIFHLIVYGTQISCSLSFTIFVCNYSYPLFFQNNIYESKRRRKFWVKRQVTDSANIEQWLLARQKVTGRVCFSIPFFDLTYENIYCSRDLQLCVC